jgi:hypothetical protein
LWSTVASTLNSWLLGLADELVRTHNRVSDMLNEAEPPTALELLPEYEAELDLVAASTTAERRANIEALLVRRQRFRPIDFQQSLSALLALAPADIVIIERTAAFALSIGDGREIFYFFVYRNPSLAGTYFLASAQAVIDKMEPSNTIGTAIESIDAQYDDPHTLYDRDLLGA